MRKWRNSTAIILAITTAFCGLSARAEEIPLHAGSVVRLATLQEGAAAITKRDRFTESLSHFDLQSRLQTNRDVTVDELLEFIGKQVLVWDKEEVELITAVVQSIQQRLTGFLPLFPPTVLLVKTTGLEEGNAAHCRGNAVVLPKKVLKFKPMRLERLLIHELFHILSTHDRPRRDSLYAIVGFKPCNNIKLPESLADHKISNPDAPTIDCYIELTSEERTFQAVPVLYASAQNYDAVKGGTFFPYMMFRLLQVEHLTDNWSIVKNKGRPVVIDPKTISDYYDQIGRNTDYIIHPDEILADNFVYLVIRRDNLATPRVTREMRKILVKNP